MKEFLEASLDVTGKYFAEVHDAAKCDQQGFIEPAQLEEFKEMGLFGMQVPEELEGLGLNNTAYARMVEVVGGVDLGVGICLGAHQSIGFKGILIAGNDAQKKKYLPDVASGRKLAAFALTEPSSGSDANSIRTRATLSDDGKTWILNGSKIWISNGGLAEIFTVFAQTNVNGVDKVTAFIVERAFGGLTNGAPERKMGIKASNTTEIYFDNVPIPAENVLGEVGGGFKVAMAILNNGRFGMGAALSGTMKTMIARSADHAENRVQFGSKIATYGAIQEKIAQMSLKLYATESMAYAVAVNMDRGSQDYQLEAAISKIYASEAAGWVADEAIQIHGGLGFMVDAGLERVARDLRIFRIFEGSNEILRLFVALTGMQTVGKELKHLQNAIKNPLGGMDVLFKEGRRRLVGSERPQLSAVDKSLFRGAAAVETLTADFGDCVKDLLMQHGKNIMNQQFVLLRVADAVMELFAMSCCLARASRALSEGSATAAHEAKLAEAYCLDAAEKVKVCLKEAKGKKQDKLYTEIAKDVLANGKYAATHPVGF